MIIALLALLGVDLIVIVVVLVVLLARRRWVGHKPGAFKGAIRIVDGEFSGLGPNWRRGYGRWVRDVLVWTKAPSLFRNELVAVDGFAGAERAARPGEVKRLGKEPVIVPLVANGARFEVVVPAKDRRLALGPLESTAAPFGSPAGTGSPPRKAELIQAPVLPGVRRLPGQPPADRARGAARTVPGVSSGT